MISLRTVSHSLVFSVAALSACATTSAPADSPSVTPAPSAAVSFVASSPPTFAEQVAAGGALYGQNCASCHGDAGQGGKAPRLVGLKEGALPLDPPADRKFRKTPFVTVADVATFVVANMPPKKGGTLPANQSVAILAFDLSANGITLPTPLTLALAQTLTIPR
jgi:mono/diheme cytochrome c family protein